MKFDHFAKAATTIIATALLHTPVFAAQPIKASDQPIQVTAPLDAKKVEEILHAYLLEHPEVIPEAMKRLEERRLTERIAELRTALETPFEGAWIGNPKGDVVIVEFFDYACGYCRRSAGDVERLVLDDPGVKVVFREFPILGAGSAEAARFGLQAARAGTYAQFHHDMFKSEELTKATIRAAAARGKLKLPKDLAPLNAELAANHRLARQLGITGTPAFFIGGKFVSGAIGIESLKEEVAAARKNSATRPQKSEAKEPRSAS